jgi:hypothetical protein
MTRSWMAGVFLLCAVLSLSLVALAYAGTASKVTAQRFEGQIKSIKVDKCGLQPGSCEGSVILSQKGSGGEVSLAIKPGTWLKRGDQFVTIDELGVGNYVKVEAVELQGEPLQRITILSSGGD